MAGVGIALGLKAMFAAFGFALPAGGLTLSASSLIIAPLVGLVVTLVAGMAPAVRGSRVPPLAALRDVAVDRTATSRPRLVVGCCSPSSASAPSWLAVSGTGGLPRAGLGALLVVAGVVILGPRGLAGRQPARPPGRRSPGRLRYAGPANAMRNPRRTSGTAAALLVGVGVVTLFTVFAASLTSSVDDSVSHSFGGDLVIAPAASAAAGSPPTCPAHRRAPGGRADRRHGYGEIRSARTDGVTVANLADVEGSTSTSARTRPT